VQPFRRLRLGAEARYLLVNVGPGRDTAYASADQLYSEAAAPGILHQSNFIVGGGFVQFDWRDRPLFPHSGGYYSARFMTYDSQTPGYSFGRFDLEAHHYIPFFNERRTIALRGRIQADDRYAGDRVPFYLQPTLGGDSDLRGYRPFRFYDNASAVLNAEYRWQVFYGMEMALFADAGSVFDRWQQTTSKAGPRNTSFGWSKSRAAPCT
jgi:outer membrane protein assembly factor BamA